MTAAEELAVEDLSVSFATEAGAVQALAGVSFALAPGGTLGIVGESGAGKSITALTLLGLVDAPSLRVSGRAIYGDLDLLQLSADERRAVRGRRIAIVFQDPLAALHPLLSVGRQIVEAIRAHQPLGRQAARDRAVELLELVRMPSAHRRIDQYPHELSGGMRQRALLAIALANRPELLIADEPTSALDVTVQAAILDLIAELQRDLGMSLLLISHDFGVIARLADEVAVMCSGHIVERGPAEQVLSRPRDPYTRRLLDAVPRLDRPSAARPPPRTPPVLEVAGLVRHFRMRSRRLRGEGEGVVKAVDGVSFTVAAGETLALVGESGCGKTTLCRTVLRLIEPDAGSIRIGDRETVGRSQRELRRLRSEMQMVFQDPYASLNPRRRVGEIVAEPLRIHRAARGPELARRRDEALALVGLGRDHRDRYPHELSGGERQRVGIARALVLRPRLVIADEPVSALDVSIQAAIIELLAELRDELGLALVFVAHDLAVVRRVADRIAVMQAGRFVEVGPADEVCEQPGHPYTRELLAAAV